MSGKPVCVLVSGGLDSDVLVADLLQRVAVSFPYATLGKEQVAELIPEFPVALTFSCLSPRGFEHCGRCNKCEERERALRVAL